MSSVQLSVALLLAVTGSAFFNLQPLFIAAAQPLYGLSDSQIGWLAAGELAGIAAISLILTRHPGDFNYRRIALVGLACISAGNVATLYADVYWQLFVARLFTGFAGDGPVYIVAIILLGRAATPTRLFGIMVFLNMLVTALGLRLLPVALADKLWPGLLLYLAGIALLGLLFAAALPGKIKTGIDRAPVRFDREAKLLLLAIWAFAINLGVIWSYAERLGTSAGLGTGQIAVYLSYSLPLQAGGALLAALVSTRLGRVRSFLGVVVCQLLAIALLAWASPGKEWAYFAGISLWGFSWNFGIAYLLGLAAEQRTSRGILIWVPCTEAIGVSAGPAIAAYYLGSGSYLPVYATAILALLLSALFYLVVVRSTRREISTS